ncbi:MAG: malate/lactate/ureidoglycolate dehydrogenase [Rubrivivax sp.]|nr:malate/lactate/ureidoglycolate dehydrogenase [Rubrivivax sp.]
MHVFAVGPLRAAMRLVVAGFGSAREEIDAVVDNLVEANLTGHDSHGIGMLPRYAASYLEGGLKPNTHVRVVHDAGAVLRLDGDTGFGQVIGHEAMALGIERAKRLGTCVVALGHSHHLGRIGAWAEQAAAAGLVSLHFVNVVSRPIVAPFGGARAGFGTNPFTAGVPLPGRPPFILDFATSRIAQGKTRVAYNKGELVPEGCLIDDRGRPTREPRFSVVPPTGAILTFGEHKGYGLAALCELLGGALAAGLVGHREDGTRMRVWNGMLSVLLDPAALGNVPRFEAEAGAFVESLLGAPAREGFERVLVAGDPERAMRAERTARGVPVDATTWQQILDAAKSLGVDPRGVHAAAAG